MTLELVAPRRAVPPAGPRKSSAS